ncbi:uncharacterized protein LOC119464792 [Dermacentor silvarum]|uniref:uncharacterized protein LOC119464792 n=1 Tax=Dermacentor silvarum TaxID=543639 RepID=UPI002101756B|nr:uncharacterized protein LOC119464792 [Dermacentor silvarum]
MILFGFVAVLFGTLADTTNPARYSSPAHGTPYNFAASTATPMSSCYYSYYNRWNGWQYKLYREGTPCWLPWTYSEVGYCSKGTCYANITPSVNTCNNAYEGGGYPTNCDNPACNGTPCILVLTAPNRAFAGLCKGGHCVASYELSADETRSAHPQMYRKCPEKEHYGSHVSCPLCSKRANRVMQGDPLEDQFS